MSYLSKVLEDCCHKLSLDHRNISTVDILYRFPSDHCQSYTWSYYSFCKGIDLGYPFQTNRYPVPSALTSTTVSDLFFGFR